MFNNDIYVLNVFTGYRMRDLENDRFFIWRLILCRLLYQRLKLQENSGKSKILASLMRKNMF